MKINTDLIHAIFITYVVTSIVMIALGIGERNNDYTFGANRCDKPTVRIELLFPAFQLGCWLGKPLKEPK